MKCKRFLLCLAAASMVWMLASCGASQTEAPTSAAASGSETDALQTTFSAEAEWSVPEETAAQAETTSSAQDADNETTLPEETQTEIAMPTQTAEIVQLYDDALNRIADHKASFTKSRRTDEIEYKPPMGVEAFKDDVFNFMGINQQTKDRVTAKDSYDHYLQHARLTASDVDSATCTKDGDGNYRIEMHVKSGNSFATNGRIECNAPLDKSGIAVGENDKAYWDHKVAQNVYAPLSNVAKNVKVNEQYDNAVITAVVRPDGAIVRVNMQFDFAFDISAALGLHGSAKGRTFIQFDQFDNPKA